MPEPLARLENFPKAVVRMWLLLVALNLTGGARAEPIPPYPQPRSSDGRFLNLAGEMPQAGVAITFPFFARRITKSDPPAAELPSRVDNDGTVLARTARTGVATITWIGHATLLVQMGGQTFLTDPIWAQRASPLSWAGPKRFQAPGIDLDDLPPIDFVLVSHNHYDHLDVPTLAEIAFRNTRARFFVPLENGDLLREAGIPGVEEMGWGEIKVIGDLEIHCLPAQHWSRRGLNDLNRALWASWAVRGPDDSFYFAGDTGYFSGFAEIGERLGPFDLAAVPIGAYEPRAMMQAFHTNPAEAVRAGVELKAKRLIGMHYGTFDLSDETPKQAARAFREAAALARYRPEQILLPAIGETRALNSSMAVIDSEARNQP